MTRIILGIPEVENSLDDILIHAADLNTPRLRLRTRLDFKALKDAEVMLNRVECGFEVQNVQFPCHMITSEVITIDPDKVASIGLIKIPSSKKDLQRLLGKI